MRASCVTIPGAGFRVIPAQDLAEAVTRLLVDQQTRWGDIIADQRAEVQRHGDIVGRQWLHERIESRIAARESERGAGYVLLTARAGVGKSAAIAGEIRRAERPVYHFIRRGMGRWDEPQWMLRSLEAQLRRRHGLVAVAGPRGGAPLARLQGAFLSTLQRVSNRLKEEGQRRGQRLREVIYLDGLDEAFGPTGRFAQVALPGVLPKELPEGIFVVLTSRLGEDLAWLADPALCDTVELDPAAPDNLDDIHVFLRRENERRQLGLGEAFVDRLVDASEGLFLVAERYVRPRAELRTELEAWQRDSGKIPRGFTGWITAEWQRLVTVARKTKIRDEVVRAVLGLLVTARDPLSRRELGALLRSAGGQGSPSAVSRTRREATAGAVGSVRVAQIRRRLDDVLRLATEFFDAGDPGAGEHARYRFFHTSFAEFVARTLRDLEPEDCHRVLARGCAYPASRWSWSRSSSRRRPSVFFPRPDLPMPQKASVFESSTSSASPVASNFWRKSACCSNFARTTWLMRATLMSFQFSTTSHRGRACAAKAHRCASGAETSHWATTGRFGFPN